MLKEHTTRITASCGMLLFLIEEYTQKYHDITIPHFNDMQHEMQHKKENPRIYQGFQRAIDGARTRGLDLGKVARYQLRHYRIYLTVLSNAPHYPSYDAVRIAHKPDTHLVQESG